MFHHITLGTNDVVKSTAFYDEVLAKLGFTAVLKVSHETIYALPGTNLQDPKAVFFAVMEPYNGKAATVGNGSMTAFTAPTRQDVDAAYAKALELGGTCDGEPGPRPAYGEGWYAAYVRDLDNNKLAFVHITAI